MSSTARSVTAAEKTARTLEKNCTMPADKVASLAPRSTEEVEVEAIV